MIALFIATIALFILIALIVAIVDHVQTAAYARETAALVARKQALITHTPDMTYHAIASAVRS